MNSLKFLEIKRRKDLVKAADASYVARRKEEEDRHRPVLGASDLSKECDRAVWYTWRHTKAEDFKGKGSTLRLFEVGHNQEPIFARDLKAAGVKIFTHRPDGKQFRFSIFGGHFAVNLDGLALVPPEGGIGQPKNMIVEMKTMNAANFERLEMVGAKECFPGYYRQMQAQALAFKVATKKTIDGFLFVAVNKNTSKYHFEEIEEDVEEQRAIWRMLMAIIQKDAPAPMLQTSQEAKPCRFCNYRKICREGLTSEVEKSCRSCAYAEPVGVENPMVDGPAEWKCNKGHEYGTVCSDHEFSTRY